MTIERPDMIRLWRRIPVVIRAVLVGFLVNEAGQLAGLFIFANLKLVPQVPWMLPAAAAWLWLFWRCLNGWGWPRATREARRLDLRAPSVSGRVWRWSLLAGPPGAPHRLGLAVFPPGAAG